jgi:hypothetical protein
MSKSMQTDKLYSVIYFIIVSYIIEGRLVVKNNLPGPEEGRAFRESAPLLTASAGLAYPLGIPMNRQV